MRLAIAPTNSLVYGLASGENGYGVLRSGTPLRKLFASSLGGLLLHSNRERKVRLVMVKEYRIRIPIAPTNSLVYGLASVENGYNILWSGTPLRTLREIA
ncbi:hypothetical protein LSTR_LSTR006505 [Laodelphax striatellus]|uniref:Uncharacterized protein n=1 Tax=Laodelphax striatellus TaxID=195883 RepID=A0A482WXT2_LAOST|nr:hypothetical protein LSTR_LSTR006505 [Laodelphax striatellus]